MIGCRAYLSESSQYPYARKILAVMSSRYQDELAILHLLHVALSEYGYPIVSDNAAVFTAKALEYFRYR